MSKSILLIFARSVPRRWCITAHVRVGLCLILALTQGVEGWGVNLSPRAWKTSGSGRVTLSQASDGLAIPLPTWPGWIGYAWTTPAGPLAGTLFLSVRVDTVGQPVFRWDTEPGNTCVGTPATVRPFFSVCPYRKCQSIAYTRRWWSNPIAIQLAAGSQAIVVPLDPQFWSGVNGEFADQDAATQALWEADRQQADRVGLSFGGGCFFGHGVGVEGGTARVVVTGYQVS